MGEEERASEREGEGSVEPLCQRDQIRHQRKQRANNREGGAIGWAEAGKERLRKPAEKGGSEEAEDEGKEAMRGRGREEVARTEQAELRVLLSRGEREREGVVELRGNGEVRAEGEEGQQGAGGGHLLSQPLAHVTVLLLGRYTLTADGQQPQRGGAHGGEGGRFETVEVKRRM